MSRVAGFGDAVLRAGVARLGDVSRLLAQRARRDPLTGLPNRAAILDRLDTALGRAAQDRPSVGVLVVDLDGFRSVNDDAGTARGDAALRVVAHRMNGVAWGGPGAASLRVGQRLVGRLGDDEFALVVEHAGGGDVLDVLRHLGERLVAVVQRPVELDGRTLRLSGSVGGAVAGPDHDPVALLREANAAIGDAKRQGKGRVCLFDPAAARDHARHARIEHDLRRALGEDELTLHLQPVLEAADGRVAGAEALIRWQLPSGAVLGPDDFVPVAEDSSLVVELGRLALRKACAELAAWDAAGLGELRLAVNVGGRHLEQGDLVADVRGALAAARVAPGRLTLELTESGGVGDVEHAAAVLGELRGLGVRIALDDFGTGWASITYLRRLPVDVLKLDRSYVAGLGVDERETAIVRGLLQLATSIGVDVVAEGVETAQQHELLRGLGCRWVQGYLLGRPMPAAAFAAWVAGR